MHPVVLPDKIYFKIGEVARIADLKTSVIRFWETEFSFLQPEKSSTGQRLYTRQEIDLILQVKHLLYEEKYTIEGVRKKLSFRRKPSAARLNEVAGNQEIYKNKLYEIRQELINLKALL